MIFKDFHAVQRFMIDEIQDDIVNSKIYLSPNLNQKGIKEYPNIFLNSVKRNGIDDFISNLTLDYFNTHTLRNTKNGPIFAKMRFDANIMLCQSEFNRFYMRAICLKSLDENKKFVKVYRAGEVKIKRSISYNLIGKEFLAEEILNDLRQNPGKETRYKLGSPNSGLSVELIL